jgi:glycosyltransferase involved in cell wall biosynthesis
MKILVLHSELGVLRGGGENFTKNLFSSFAESGHDVSAAFVADSSGRYPIPLPKGIQAIPMPGWWSRKLGQATLSAIGRGLSSLGIANELWGQVQEAVSWRTIKWHGRRFQRRVEEEFVGRWGSYDAIYVHGDATLAGRVARYRPTVLRLPGPVGVELAPALRAVDAVCANGDALGRLRALFGDMFVELPPGIDGERFSAGQSPIRSELTWTEKHRVAGYVGRLTHLKGVDLLAEAFHQVAKTLPDARFMIVGSGELENTVRSVLAEEIGRGVVHMEADVPHERLADWYRAMDVLVMPSRYENYSNSILEAMSCGTAVLASNVGGNRLLADTGAGWLFDSGCAASLATDLHRVLADTRETARRGKKAAEHMRGRHSWKATSERLENIINAHISGNG